MEPTLDTTAHSRLGFHYAADSLHYREKDLQTWLPELQKMGAGWLTLQAPAERAVPEVFLSGLLQANIRPILQFELPVSLLRPGDGLRLLFNHYARLGVEYVVFYDRPNMRRSWAPDLWTQSDLVERFLDQYLPLAELAVTEGLTPVFPPLEPGGDYWDLAFISSALESLQRRGCQHLLEKLVLGVYARAGNRPLTWGAGGSQRWPGARPYMQQDGIQDHRGFLSFEWYLEICQKVLGCRLPVILFQAGSQLGDCQDSRYEKVDATQHASRNLALIQWLHRERVIFGLNAKPADEVLACNFWLLQAEKGQPEYRQAWFHSDGRNLPLVTELYRWAASRRGELLTVAEGMDEPKPVGPLPPPEITAAQSEPDGMSEPPTAPEGMSESPTAPEGMSEPPTAPEGISESPTAVPVIEGDPLPPGEAVTDEFLQALDLIFDENPAATSASGSIAKNNVAKDSIADGKIAKGNIAKGSIAQGSIAKGSIAQGIMSAQETTPISHYVLLPLYAWGVADWDMELILPLIEESHPTIGFSLAEARMAQRVTIVGGNESISEKAIESLRQAGCLVERLAADGTLVAT